MKERIFFDDEFEKKLKERADQFKMYPSDKVWSEVYSSLHTRRRRFVTGMGFLITGILLLAGAQLIFPTGNPRPNPATVKNNALSEPGSLRAGLPGFTEIAFAPDPAEITGGRPTNGGTRHAVAPYMPLSVISANQLTGSAEMNEILPERMTSAAQVKPVQPASLKSALKPADAPIGVPDLVPENAGLPGNKSSANQALSGLSREKPVDQPARLHNDRLSWEIYITPTMNTHYLDGLNYQAMSQSIPSAPIMVVHIANVNGFVDNTPVMGYALGGNILYRISKNISLKAGLEFSYNRYYIKAYNSNLPQASATLSSYLGYIADSMVNASAGTGISKNPQHYQNRYYELALPVGIEMKVAGLGRWQLHLGASLQPSYLLNTDAYVLSGDYSSYIKNPQAFRRWNLNAGAEAFISYGVGKLRWELGPQLRYQIFSTYKNSYPLKENMLIYGIRIGISKTIW